jgi:hypothetical protein
MLSMGQIVVLRLLLMLITNSNSYNMNIPKTNIMLNTDIIIRWLLIISLIIFK